MRLAQPNSLFQHWPHRYHSRQSRSGVIPSQPAKGHTRRSAVRLYLSLTTRSLLPLTRPLLPYPGLTISYSRQAYTPEDLHLLFQPASHRLLGSDPSTLYSLLHDLEKPTIAFYLRRLFSRSLYLTDTRRYQHFFPSLPK